MIKNSLTISLEGDVEAFSSAISQANNILYLTDNAGEIVLDQLLIEQMPTERVTVAVRGLPVINDATMKDAEETGLTDLVTVIDNGSDAPGTLLEDCSPAFQQCFTDADLIIAKGQGNFESLNEVRKDIFFLLKAKCPLVSEHLGYPVGSLVLKRSNELISNSRIMEGVLS